MTIAVGMMPLIPVGHAGREGTSALGGFASVLCDAAKEASQMWGHVVWADGGSHTVDTTGSSSIGWRSGAVTFANAGSTFKVGIAAIDTANGPPARAANASDVITFDVAAVFTGGGGGVTATAWQTSVPTTGTKTIAHGDLVVVGFQMTAVAGGDLVNVQHASASYTQNRPGVTSFTSSTYNNEVSFPNVALTASDGTLGFIAGGYVGSVGQTNQSFSNISAKTEYGNLINLPFPARCYGIICGSNFAVDCDLVLYSDPLGTPVAQKTLSVDANTLAISSTASHGIFLFPSTYDLLANTNYAAIVKPASSSNIQMGYKTFGLASHQAAELMGTNNYAINRSSGAFAAQNSSKDLFSIGLLLGGFDAGGAAGGLVVNLGLAGGML